MPRPLRGDAAGSRHGGGLLRVVGLLLAFLLVCGSTPAPVAVARSVDAVSGPEARGAARQQPDLSEEDREEVEQGAEADRQIEAQFGFYQDEELQAYVERIGDELAAVSERPQLPWTFRVLDSPVVNAFALPGGFVYVTRGLLAYMNSEAELAGVLGHEIGHVTGRHSAQRRRRGILGTLGTLGAIGGLAIFSPEAAGFLLRSGLAQNVTGLLLLKYSRDQELDADQRGIRYATAAGYDPRGIGGFFATLQGLEEASDRKGLPGWLSTHPQVDDRIQRSSRWADESLARTGADLSELVTGQTAHLFAVDGLVFGENPREGFMRDDRFLHPDLAFEITFPAGWDVNNGRQAVTARDPRERAMISLSLAARDEGQSATDYVRQTLRRIDARVSEQRRTSVNGLEALEVSFQARSGNSVYAVYGLWVLYDGNLYELMGVTSPQRWREYLRTLRGSLTSFRELTDPEALATEPARVEVVRAPQGMLLAGLIESRPDVSVEPDSIALLNRMRLETPLQAGEPVKLVVGGPETVPSEVEDSR